MSDIVAGMSSCQAWMCGRITATTNSSFVSAVSHKRFSALTDRQTYGEQLVVESK